MPPPSDQVRELVLIGGGHSHIQVLKAFAMKPPPGVRLTLVTDRSALTYSGMVPGFLAGQYERRELEIDLVPLARRAGAAIVLAAAVGVVPEENLIRLADRPGIRYTVASFNLGSAVNKLAPGIAEHGIPTRPMHTFVERVRALFSKARQSSQKEFRVVIVGGGAGGIELAFSVNHTLQEAFRISGKPPQHPAFRVILIGSAEQLLPERPGDVSERLERIAKDRGIELMLGTRVVRAHADHVMTSDGTRVNFSELLWVGGVQAQPLFADSGLSVDERGFVSTRSTLQLKDHDNLFAAGDCATLLDSPETPHAGVYAVRQGPILARNLRAYLRGRPLRSYKPQNDFMMLLNLGDGTALGHKWGVTAEGRWVMRLKDRIDREFLARFRTPPPSEDAEGMTSKEPMVCGGCAAKPPQAVLQQALDRLGQPEPQSQVLLGLAEADDASAYTTRQGDVVVRSVDGFGPFIDDPYTCGRVSALNALSDLFAKGATPRFALAMLALEEGLSPRAQQEFVFQVLSGAKREFQKHDVALLGGHTTTSQQSFIGFSVDGEAEGELNRLTQLQAGDLLVLTKPLGTGVVFNAHMRGIARGEWFEAALASVLESNSAAAEVARRCGVRAATDITGFGLLNHLLGFCQASKLAAVLDPSRVKALPGALELLAAGVRSTVHAQNSGALSSATQSSEFEHAKLELCCDPQTSGGLLLAAKPELADTLLSELRLAGVEDARVVAQAHAPSAGTNPLRFESIVDHWSKPAGYATVGGSPRARLG